MKSGTTFILKSAVIMLGLGALAVLILVIPPAINSDQTGYYRPILIGMYGPAIPFFIALYQALKLLSYIEKGKAFSELSVNTLKNIKYCAITISVLYAIGMPYIFNVADRDDAPGAAAVGFVIIGASFVIAVFAGLLQKILKDALDLKSENDLTV